MLKAHLNKKVCVCTPVLTTARVVGEVALIFSGLRGRGGVHPGQVPSPLQGSTETHRTNRHSQQFRETN
ncbi:hypothetical protein AMECASPLE_000596 [Ameca splendens]|uniref:Uncharacterized protein n=1 Tax=Ameca splendens TaxID=208324 RepID=A0ABV1A5S0_9TELE